MNEIHGPYMVHMPLGGSVANLPFISSRTIVFNQNFWPKITTPAELPRRSTRLSKYRLACCMQITHSGRIGAMTMSWYNALKHQSSDCDPIQGGRKVEVSSQGP